MSTDETKRFEDLGLSAQSIDAINRKGFEEPTAIQALTIPGLLEDQGDLIAQAQTGTGKTAAFGLPLLELVKEDQNHVQGLVLAPTRELAIQVAEEILSLRGERRINVLPVYGGQAMSLQFRGLKRGAQIVVGTPGRVIDHLNRGSLKLDGLTHLVLDEADEMLNMGFVEDMEEILAHTPEDKRVLLFSATMPKKIKELAQNYMKDHKILAVKKEQLTTNLTEQIYFEVKASDKFEALCRIIDIEEDFYGMVFCRTKRDVDEITAHLLDRGYDAEAIHGDITQAQREKTLNKFRKKHSNILVCTDVAARGIDIQDLTHVINHALPQDPESYVHRIGRTGRAGNQGTAVTFITPSEYRRLMFIQKIARAEIKKSELPKVKDIIKAKRRKIYQELGDMLDRGIDESFQGWAVRLCEEREPMDVLASLLQYSFQEQINPENYGEIKEVSRDSSRGRERDRNFVAEGKARLFIALGKKDGLSPRKTIDLLQSRVDIKSKDIGDIQIMDNFSFITVPFQKAEAIIANFHDQGQRPLVTRAKEGKKGSFRGNPRGDYNRGGYKKGGYKKDGYQKNKSRKKHY